MLSFKCIECTMNKADFLLSNFEKDAARRMQVMEEVKALVGSSPPEETSPVLNARVMRLLKKRLGLGDIYREVKEEYNRYLLSLEEGIQAVVEGSGDRLLAALRYAMAGNFIDFGAMNSVDREELGRLLESSQNQTIDPDRYSQFREDLCRSGRIVYLADNAGEIVLDKVLIKEIRRTRPEAEVTVVVRGEPIHNDATMKDAEETGITDIARVISNGTDIPGTDLDKVNRETRNQVENADLIISKGQGNFETLYGSGRNIYYLFLCKCSLFAERFRADRFQGIFANERNVKEMID
jgi:hypothetical protein